MRVWVVGACLLTLACRVELLPKTTIRPLDPAFVEMQPVQPSLGAVPYLDEAKLSPSMGAGLSLARQLLSNTFPRAPEDHRYAQLRRWIEREVTPWIAARRDGVDEVRFEFGLTQGAAPDEPIIAQAVLAVLQEDTALGLQRIPSPVELDAEPEIAEVFQELVQTESKPFVQAARNEYARCANAGYERGSELLPLAKFCHARYDRLGRGERDARR